MSLNNKILVRYNWIVLLSFFYVASCQESILDKWDANQYKINKALISYAKEISQASKNNNNNKFLKFIFPPDTTYNFISKRYYTSDSSFVDYQVLGSSPTALQGSMYFEIKNGHWYLFDGYKWQLFYDGKNIYPVELFYISKRLTHLKKYQYRNEYLYTFEPFDSDTSVQYLCGFPEEHIFSPKHGIVLIKTSAGYFRRTDFSFNPKEFKLVKNDSN